jgi:hypothetical protein
MGGGLEGNPRQSRIMDRYRMRTRSGICEPKNKRQIALEGLSLPADPAPSL